mmetsp:Transcript_83572/g.218299  ORF Transcript_83572/g.218299 Transcript_83572/m.218299 type:complete len:215 (-) Transcript_83572:259-903(-)
MRCYDRLLEARESFRGVLLQSRPLPQRNKLLASIGRSCCIGVVVFTQQPSDIGASISEALDVKIQVFHTLVRAAAYDLQLHRAKLRPAGHLESRAVHLLGAEEKSACPHLVGPRPCDVQRLEIQFPTMCAQLARIRHDGEQRVVAGLSARDLDQNGLARPPQIKPFAVDVLQMRVARCRRWHRCDRRCWCRRKRRHCMRNDCKSGHLSRISNTK